MCQPEVRSEDDAKKVGEEGCRQISYILYKVPGTQLPIRDLVLQNDNHKKMERGDGNRLQGESVDQKKRKEKNGTYKSSAYMC